MPLIVTDALQWIWHERTKIIALMLVLVLVVPQPDHFAKITSRDAEEIYAEVTLGGAAFDTWLRNG